jgi:hypothetical protein
MRPACSAVLLALFGSTAGAAPPVAASAEGRTTRRPLLHAGAAPGLEAELSGHLRASYLDVESFRLDRDGTPISPSPLETRIRLAPALRVDRVSLVGEADLLAGAARGVPPSDLRLGASPHPELAVADLRQLFLEYRSELWRARLGQQTSHWGLGLVANSGAHDAAPGDFGDARSGDRTLRALVVGRPLYALGGAYRALEPVLAADWVVRDDTIDTRRGDRALQGVFALRFAVDDERHLGVYTAYRRQNRAGAGGDFPRTADVLVLDVAGRWKWGLAASGIETRVAAEAAWITGRSSLARSVTAPDQRLRQVGAVAKGAARLGSWEALLDLGYASGDRNPYDDLLEGFRFDSDLHAGVVLYEELLGWHTARGYAWATDPQLLGVAPEGSELLPSRGAVFGSAYAFPRLRWAAREWLDIYGGPLLAIATAPLSDPFNTRLAGGTPRNALNGAPGGWLGTEYDLGAQVRFERVRGMELSLTAEGGYLVPGNAFVDATGRRLDPIAAGRLRAAVRF